MGWTLWSLTEFSLLFLLFRIGLSWVIHAWTSNFKLFQENESLELSLGWGICAQWGDWGFLMSCAHPLFFSTPSKPISLFITKHFIERPRISSTRDLWLKQNSLKFCSEPLLMVYKIEWVYLLLCQGPICKTGSNDVYFKGSCLMSFERIFKRCKYTLLELQSTRYAWNYHGILAHQ